MVMVAVIIGIGYAIYKIEELEKILEEQQLHLKHEEKKILARIDGLVQNNSLFEQDQNPGISVN